MKFSDNTIEVLKNFSQINPSILFRSGNTLRTISPQKTVMAAAPIAETIEKTAGVYDVSRFLATLSLFDSPEVEFGENQFDIKDAKSALKYTYTAENMIVSPPDKDIQVPDIVANIDITWKDLKRVRDAAGVLGLPEVAFSSTGNGVMMAAVDSKNSTADNFSIDFSEDEAFEPFDMIIKAEYLKLLENDYSVALSSKGMAHFKSEQVEYWIAIESR